jgi:hypothetical protein
VPSRRYAQHVVALAALVFSARPAAASDFWDAVRDPGSGSMRAHALAAARALASNQAAAALNEAEHALASCAHCPDALVLHGRALAALGRPGEALPQFQRARELAPAALDAETDALAAAGSALRVDQPAFAAAVLQRALGAVGDAATRSRALGMLADALQAQGAAGLTQAIAGYRDASADADADPGAAIGLALALFRQGEIEPALALARRADAGETERAIFARALPPAELHARIAVLRMALADDEAAERAWRRAGEGGGPWCDQARAALAAGLARPQRSQPKTKAPRGRP